MSNEKFNVGMQLFFYSNFYSYKFESKCFIWFEQTK
jgi:hypothetical protein